MIKLNIQYFGGRGASIPTVTPLGGGGKPGNMDEKPGSANTLNEALGTQGRAMSDARAVLGANPFFNKKYDEYSFNCQRCVIATEARKRGYDVIALPTFNNDTMPSNNNYIRQCFKNPTILEVGKTTRGGTQRAVEQQMKQFGNGSRAVLAVQWANGGGHAINLVQKNGKTEFYDGQTGQRYKAKDLFNQVKTGKAETRLTRVDNLEFADGAKEAIRQNPLNKRK